LHAQAGAVLGQHHLVQLDRLARGELHALRVRLALQAVELADRLAQRLSEAASLTASDRTHGRIRPARLRADRSDVHDRSSVSSGSYSRPMSSARCAMFFATPIAVMFASCARLAESM